MPRGAKPGERRGGRTVGTPNKDTAELVALLKSKYPKWDPVIAMAEIANTCNDVNTQLQAAKEVAQYIYPKRKAIEHSGPDGQQLATLIVNVPPLPDGGPKR